MDLPCRVLCVLYTEYDRYIVRIRFLVEVRDSDSVSDLTQALVKMRHKLFVQVELASDFKTEGKSEKQ